MSTKIHLCCDIEGHPLGFEVTAGQTHESAALVDLLNAVDQDLVDAEGEPIAWPAAMAGDKGYRAEWIDDLLLALEIKPVIPSKSNEDRDARAVDFDPDAYRGRNIIERLIGWLKECRRVFARYEKTAKNFLGMLRLAAIRYYLRLLA